MKKNAELINETDLAARIGVNRELVRVFRNEKLEEGKHFAAGRSIKLTREGAQEVEKYFGVAHIKTKEIGGRAAHRAIVRQIFGVNRGIIEVELEDMSRKRVKVRNNRLFVVGQEIPVIGTESCPVWRLACPQPRSRGRVRWKREK